VVLQELRQALLGCEVAEARLHQKPNSCFIALSMHRWRGGGPLLRVRLGVENM
jgi:hypothetical protein